MKTTFKKRAWFTIVQLLATIAVVGIITAWSYYVLSKGQTADNATKFKTDLVTTVGLLSDKAIANETADTTYNLGKLIWPKGIYSSIKKTWVKDMGNDQIDTRVSGIVFYDGTQDEIVLGNNGIVAGTSSLGSGSINDDLWPNKAGLFLATSWNLDNYCDGFGIDTDDKILTVKDTKDNANADTDNICRGVLNGDAKSSIMYVYKTEKAAEKANTEYFDNEWEVKPVVKTAWDTPAVFYVDILPAR